MGAMPHTGHGTSKTRLHFLDLPLDLLLPVFSHLSDRRDRHACTLVCRSFNTAATPFLYRVLESRITPPNASLRHPAKTLLKRPELAEYVRHVSEKADFHLAMCARNPGITEESLQALALCKNLSSFSWTDANMVTDDLLPSFVSVMKALPLQEITVRTHSELSEMTWSHLKSLAGLQRVCIWCMEGPPKICNGAEWAEGLGNTLTHLELGVSAFSYPCTELLSQFPRLKALRLKGAPASSIPLILSCLPKLRSLDTQYVGSSEMRRRKVSGDSSEPSSASFPGLKSLTLRTNEGAGHLWTWIRGLVPKPGLETFKLHGLMSNKNITVPNMFILEMALLHGDSLKHFVVDDAQLSLPELECLCSHFINLETVECAVPTTDLRAIAKAISDADRLRTLKIWSVLNKRQGPPTKSSVDEVKSLMLTKPQLRVICIGSRRFTGAWKLASDDGGLYFDVTEKIDGVKWT